MFDTILPFLCVYDLVYYPRRLFIFECLFNLFVSCIFSGDLNKRVGKGGLRGIKVFVHKSEEELKAGTMDFIFWVLEVGVCGSMCVCVRESVREW